MFITRKMLRYINGLFVPEETLLIQNRTHCHSLWGFQEMNVLSKKIREEGEGSKELKMKRNEVQVEMTEQEKE